MFGLFILFPFGRIHSPEEMITCFNNIEKRLDKLDKLNKNIEERIEKLKSWEE